VLWEKGCLDALLLDACAIVSPEQVPVSVQTRLYRILAQEVCIPSGDFIMGSDSLESWSFEAPAHQVTLTKPFYIGRFPITQFLYWVIGDAVPSHFKFATHPVESVSWLDAIKFCNALSISQDLQVVYTIHEDGSVEWDRSSPGYRLPTEAEWECAAKAWQNHRFAGSDSIDDVGWYEANSKEKTALVGQKQPNAAGIYDLNGNVWEWCWDRYDESYYFSKQNIDPEGHQEALERSCRGGAFTSSAESSHTTIRGRFTPDIRWKALGFRVVRNSVD
jgi:formylglycine-generating enzyme required for sulfatase activity